jgi:hypothetical protein
MIILKHALLGSFRIALLGMLKFALFTYTFFLPNTGFAANGPESDGQASKNCRLWRRSQWQHQRW